MDMEFWEVIFLSVELFPALHFYLLIWAKLQRKAAVNN